MDIQYFPSLKNSKKENEGIEWRKNEGKQAREKKCKYQEQMMKNYENENSRR